jgi:hypothetical protein
MAANGIYIGPMVAGLVMIVTLVGLTIFFVRARFRHPAKAPLGESGEPKPRLQFTGYYGHKQPDHGSDADAAPPTNQAVPISKAQRLAAPLPPLPADPEMQVG